MIRAASIALFLVVLLTQDLIDLEFSMPIGGWSANAPVTDLAGLALFPLVLWTTRRGRMEAPGAIGYTIFLLACMLSLLAALDPGLALHHVVRKPLFYYLVFAIGLARATALSVPQAWVWRGLWAWFLTTSALSLVTSGLRILSGDLLWFHGITGITPNHKTLAVALAGALPLLIEVTLRRGGWRWLALGFGVVALGASLSKTAWITAALGVSFFIPRHRPLGLRPAVTLPALGLAVALALYAPVIVGSKTMLDAARSRHSLNVRAWRMFADHPLFGAGAGTNVHIEMVTFPHYRVNGVDAHGVVQKIASETGILGLAGYGLFALSTGAALRRRWGPGGNADASGPAYAAAATWATLHANLLLSTETFSPTHWVPLGIAWGLSHASVEGERSER